MMKTRIIRPLLRAGMVLAAMVLLAPIRAHADGGMFPPYGWSLWEFAQHAFLEYDQEAHSERLSILPSFRGDAMEFAWVVPVPAPPEVATTDIALFQQLDDVTQPLHRSRDGDWDCGRNYDVVYAPDAGGGVEVIDDTHVGYYHTLTLASDEAPALVDYLTGLGFLHEDNLEEATAAIEYYVAKSWYFVTFEVDSTALAETYPNGYVYYGGHLTPVELTFDADEAVYPMRISAISAGESSRVYLYVKSDHRMTFPDAETHYAHRLAAGEMGARPALAARLGAGDFLTKLRRDIPPEEMTDDIVLVRAANDREYRQVIYGSLPWTALLLLSVPVAIAVRRRFWLR